MAFRDRSSMNESAFPPELEVLFARYREAVPVPDASPDFMPKLWDRIDRQQRWSYNFRRLARSFVTVSAALCLAISAALWSPIQKNSILDGTYVDVLADNSPDDAVDSVLPNL